MYNKSSVPVGGADMSLCSQGAPGSHDPGHQRNLAGHQTPHPQARAQHTGRHICYTIR